MQAESRGWFEAILGGVPRSQRYGFQLDGGRMLPDPASRWQPDGVHRASALFFADDWQWNDQEWRGIPRAELVFYELHVGTFTPDGTFEAVIPRLASLKDLGVTAIEIMPIAQFPGSRNWGYDGVHPFAAQNSYGGPTGLLKLVDACHRHGIAVFLDVVYNHLGPEGNYLREFGPYFTHRHQTLWGQAPNFDDIDCEGVRQFVLDNVRYWLSEFHFDGLRLDAVHAIRDTSPRYILSEIQRVAQEVAMVSQRTVHIVAESDRHERRLLETTARGGCELGCIWNDDFHHSIHVILTGERAGYYADYGRPEQLVEVLNGTFVHRKYRDRFDAAKQEFEIGDFAGDRFVVCIQNHDQVGNRAVGDRFGQLLTPAQQRLAAGLMLLSPYLPLLFMGEEYGEQHPFPYFCSFGDQNLIESVRRGRREEFADFLWKDTIPDPQSQQTFESARLTWNWQDEAWQDGLRNWYRALLQCRRTHASLHDCVHRVAFWHDRAGRRAGVAPTVNEALMNVLADSKDVRTHGHHGILELVRGEPTPGEDARITAYFNFSDRPQDLVGTFVESDEATMWSPLLSSEWPQFGGAHLDVHTPTRTAKSWQLLPCEVLVLTPGLRRAA